MNKSIITNLMLTLAAGVFSFSCIYAQADISEVSIKFGVIRNYQEALGEKGYPLYDLIPEFELGGKFFLYKMNWGISIGFWNDNIQTELFRDYVTISYKAVSITPKIFYSFNSQTSSSGSIVTSVFAGLSYQLITSTPLTPVDVFGNKMKEKTSGIFEPIIGSRFGYNFGAGISFAGEIAYHLISRNVAGVHQVEYKLLIKYGP